MNDQAILELVIRAQERLDGIDRTIAAMEDMQRSTARWLRDTNNHVNKVKQSLKRLSASIKKIGEGFRTLRNIALRAFTAIVSFVGIGGMLTKLASDVSELDNVVNKSFGNMQQSVRDWANEISKQVGRADDQMLEYAATTQAMIKPLLGTNEATVEMSKNISQLVIDIGSFFNIADDQAFQKLRAGLSGESEPLKELGINLNIAALESYMLKKGIDANINTMSEAQKTMLRYNYIIENTAYLQGDAADTIDETANQMKVFKTNIEEAGEGIGTGLLPMANELLHWLNSFDIQGLGEDIGNFIKDNQEAIKSLAIFALKVTSIIGIVGLLGSAIFALATAIGVMSASILALSSLWYLNIGGIREKTAETWQAIKDKYDELVEKGVIDKIKNYGSLALNVVLEFIGDLWNDIKNERWAKAFGKVGLLAVELTLAKAAVSTLTSALIGTTFFSKSATLGALATAYFGFKLMSDMEQGDYKTMLTRILTAISLAGLGFVLGGFWGAGLGLTVAMLLDFGGMTDKLKKWFEDYDLTLMTRTYNPDSVKENVKRINNKYFDVGGYTGDGGKYEPAGIVHRGEYVMTKEMVESMPEVVAMLERVRTRGFANGGAVGFSLKGYDGGGKVAGLTFADYQGMFKEGLITAQELNVQAIKEAGLENQKWLVDIANNSNENLSQLVMMYKSFIDLKDNFQKQIDNYKEQSDKLKEKLDAIINGQNSQTMTQEQQLAATSELLSNAFANGTDVNSIKSNVGQSILSQANADLGKIFGESVKQSFLEGDLGKELNKIMDNVNKGLTGDFDADSKKLIKARKEVVDTLNEFGLTIEDAGDKVKTTFSDALSELSSFASNMAQLTGSDGWSTAGGVLSSINSFKTQFDNFKSSDGLFSLGGLTSGLGMASAVIGGVSAITSSIDKKNEKLLKEYNEQVEINKNQLELLKQIQDNTKDTVKNIIKAVAQNPTTSNITLAQEQLQRQANFMIDNPTFLDQINVTGKDKDKWYHKSQRKNYSYTMHDVAAGLGLDTSMFSGFGTDIMNLPFEELKKFQEEFSNIDYGEFKDKFKKSIDKSFSTDLEVVQKQLETYVETIEALGKAQETIEKSSRLESFEGIGFISHADAVEQYKEQLKETYKSAGYTKEEIEKMEESITSVAEGLAENTNNIVTAMQDVRSGFISAFADGQSVLESFATGLSSLFDKLKNNIAGMIYNIDLSSLNSKFEDFFEKFNVKLSEYKGTNVIGYAEKLLNNGENLQGLFSDMKKLEEKQQSMDTIVDIIREKAQEAGLSDDIIDLMLPETEVSQKAKELANTVSNALSNAMSSALEKGNDYLDFTKSMGQSIYNNAKSALINAFAESETYKKMFSKWFEMDSEGIDNMLSGITDPEEAMGVLNDYLNNLEDELKANGLDFNFAEAGSNTSDSATAKNGADYYNGADVSGEGATVINNNYYYNLNAEYVSADSYEELKKKLDRLEKEENETQA